MVMDCKLCFKRFSNGKALGAHMRSHYAILPLPPKTPPQRHEQLTEPPSESTSSAASTGKPQSSNKRKPDPEVETESAGSTRSRFKGIMNLDDDLLQDDDGDVALCLIMLSRDFWNNKNSNDDDGDGDDEDDGVSKKVFRCEKCYKVFKSSQGLGSHKATHVKKPPPPPPPFLERESQVHECALCPRVFKSAQALGGHKRSHFTSAARNLVVDLNLPVAAMKM